MFGLRHNVPLSPRAQEIGIRMALGASRQQVVRLVLHEGLATTAIGIVIGLIIAIVFTRAMSRLLFGISNLDIPTYAIASCLLILVALAASFILAFRAATIDPSLVLHQE